MTQQRSNKCVLSAVLHNSDYRPTSRAIHLDRAHETREPNPYLRSANRSTGKQAIIKPSTGALNPNMNCTIGSSLRSNSTLRSGARKCRAPINLDTAGKGEMRAHKFCRWPLLESI